MGAGGNQDSRYQVFISSTFRDLQEERQEVIQALLELDCFPAGMELFPASNEERWDLIKSVIDDSDYYLVIVGGRYGSVDETGISYTEKEYDYAVDSGTPVLGFLHANPDDIPKGKSELDSAVQKKLEAFREKVGQKMCKTWTTPSELGSVVSRSLVKLIKTNPGEGWVRAANALTPDHIEEMNELRQRVAEYELERERTRTTAPRGTEEFAQGSDLVELSYEYRDADIYGDILGAAPKTGATNMTWDAIFTVLGPAMFDEASEIQLRNRLSGAVKEIAPNDPPSKTQKNRIRSFIVTQGSFDKVIVQLVALQLIEKSEKRHGINDDNTYWRLTPYGETYVMRLRATRRPSSVGERAD
jgi:hypothetical protein